jgi:hypothetical protein
MKKYKYYYRLDENREPVGIVKADFRNEAILKAAEKKRLSYEKFIMLFGVEEINERKN